MPTRSPKDFVKFAKDVIEAFPGVADELRALMEASTTDVAGSLERVIHLCSAGGGRDGKTALSIAMQGGHVEVVVHLLGALRQEQAHALAPFLFFLVAVKFATNAQEVAPSCVVFKLFGHGMYHAANFNKLIADFAGVPRTGGAAERALAALAADAAARLPSTVPSPRGGAPCKAPPLLCIAAAIGHVDAVKVLLGAAEGGQAAAERVEVEADKDGRTPLLVAALNGHPAVVELLLAAKGVEVNEADKYGRTPLWVAAQFGHPAVVGLLLAAKGVKVNEANKDGCTPLFMAAQKVHPAVVKLLLAAEGVKVNEAKKDGTTPLFMAAEKGHPAVVKLLLAAEGVKVNEARKDGVTPLFMAAQNGHPAVVELLLAAGADPSVSTPWGTALQTAERKGHAEVAALLR